MHHEAPVSWVLRLPFLPHDPQYMHINGAVLIFLFILAFSLVANAAIRSAGNAMLVPKAGFSFGGIVDLLVEGLHGLIVGIVGHHGEKYVSFIGSIFLFVWFSNLFGLLPHSGGSPSSNVNTTFALGISSFLFYNIMGIKAHGIAGYVKHFLMGLGIFGIPIALFELLSHAIRPVTLGLRLAINLHIDHALATSFEQIFAWFLPVPLLLFGVLVCTIQAFLFAVLTSVYVQMATEHEEDH